MHQLTGRTAFVTGGGQGIGLSIGRALADEGVNVVLADIDADALEAGRAELGGRDDVATYTLDVRDRSRYAEVVADVEERIGPISILCNNAGVAAGWPLRNVTYELWDWALGINLIGVINGIQAVLPRMRARGESHIVNTASGAGLAFTNSGAVYHTTKYAVVGLSEALHAELGPQGIGVSVLCPGPVATNIIDNTNRARPPLGPGGPPDPVDRLTDEELKASMARSTPPAAVGPMVVAAIKAGQLYIHTDRYMAQLLVERNQAILDAMPPSPRG